MSVLALAGATLAATAGTAICGINPLLPGLPGNWTMTDVKGYGAVVVAATKTALTNNGNDASAMCVECHTVNPSRYVLQPANKGSYTDTSIDPRGSSDLYLGSHTVANVLVGATAPTTMKGVTHSGGGFLPRGSRDAGQYTRLTAWSNTGVSKYGNGAATAPLASMLGIGAAAANADMICESCHNILKNTGVSATVNKLTLGSYTDNGNDQFCIDCHGGTAGTYQGFHENGNLPNFNNGPNAKDHHVLRSGTFIDTFKGARPSANTTLGDYDPDNNPATNDSLRWAPNFSDKLGAAGTSYEGFTATLTLTPDSQIAFRNMVNVSGVGTRAGSNPDGDIVTTAQVGCAQCHRPHNAMTESGAFVFRKGNLYGYWGKAGTSGTALATTPDAYGLRRQFDVGDWTSNKVYGEYVNLCDGCHIGYGIQDAP